MDVSRCLFFILCLFLMGGNARTADPLLTCLNNKNLLHQHRLDREAAIRLCYEHHKSSLNKVRCYNTLKTIIAPLESMRLTEDIRSTCFYEATPAAPTLDACLRETRGFRGAAEHDEAVFYCYQQFQDKISRHDCLKAARQLIFPGKENYLTQHCTGNYD